MKLLLCELESPPYITAMSSDDTLMNPTTAIVAAHVIPYYIEKGERYLLYMDVGQEVTDMAKKIISCEVEYESAEGSGEMFPQWATLTCCPRTYKLIQWDEITYRINSILDAASSASAEAEAKAEEEAKEAWEKQHRLNCLSVALATYTLMYIAPIETGLVLLAASFILNR